MPATTPTHKLPYVLNTDKPGQYPATSKQIAEKIDAELSNRAKIKVIPYSGSANANYLNATVSFGHTYARPPAVWAVNTGGDTLHLVRVYATTTTGASVQFQTADRSNLGSISFNFFVMEQ